MSRYRVSNPPISTLYVRNISDRARNDDVKRLFQKYGKLVDVTIPLDYYSGMPKGYCFVEFEDLRDAEKAQYHMDRQCLFGRELKVEFARGDRKSGEEMRQRDREPDRYDRRGSGSSRGYDRGGYERRSRDRYRSRSRSRSRMDMRRGGGGSGSGGEHAYNYGGRARSRSRSRGGGGGGSGGGGGRAAYSRSRSRSYSKNRTPSPRHNNKSMSKSRSPRSRSPDCSPLSPAVASKRSVSRQASSERRRDTSSPPRDTNGRSSRSRSRSKSRSRSASPA